MKYSYSKRLILSKTSPLSVELVRGMWHHDRRAGPAGVGRGFALVPALHVEADDTVELPPRLLRRRIPHQSRLLDREFVFHLILSEIGVITNLAN